MSPVLLARWLALFDAYERDPSVPSGEKRPEAVAARAGIRREALFRILRKARTGEGDVETETLRKLALAIGHEVRLA